MLLLVAYDGTKYHGFAKQPGVSTIQQVIEAVLGKIDYLSRTDGGVSAAQQVISARLSRSAWQEILSANLRLPPCIRLYGFSASNAKPREASGGKEYLYVSIHHGEDEKRLQKAADFVSSGPRDFSLLVKRSRRYGLFDTRRRIKVKVRVEEPFVFFYVSGRGFLWEQVRRLVTLVKAYGLGYITFEEFANVFRGIPLRAGIPPAPPYGLALWRVKLKVGYRTVMPEQAIREWIIKVLMNNAVSYRNSWVLPSS